jgi:hypothetical protein
LAYSHLSRARSGAAPPALGAGGSAAPLAAAGRAAARTRDPHERHDDLVGVAPVGAAHRQRLRPGPLGQRHTGPLLDQLREAVDRQDVVEVDRQHVIAVLDADPPRQPRGLAQPIERLNRAAPLAPVIGSSSALRSVHDASRSTTRPNRSRGTYGSWPSGPYANINGRTSWLWSDARKR